ncbi:MAG: HAD family hydrolase [Candidatus Shapirobacteria bacterium]|nr:HAD family hydrolase [Candidatus Shapirobacteria bacterium]
MNKKNKIILFDFDGVIVESIQLALKINQEMFTNLQLSDMQRWAEGDVYNSKLLEGVDSVKQEEYYFSQYSKRLTTLMPVKGIEEILKEIKAMKYKMIIVSGSSEASIWEFLKKYKLDNFFEEVMAVETSKSKKEKFKMVFEKYKIKAKETVMITDTVGDLKDANETEIKSIGVVWGVHNAEILKKNGADFIAEKPEDMVVGIKKLLALN